MAETGSAEEKSRSMLTPVQPIHPVDKGRHASLVTIRLPPAPNETTIHDMRVIVASQPPFKGILDIQA